VHDYIRTIILLLNPFEPIEFRFPRRCAVGEVDCSMHLPEPGEGLRAGGRWYVVREVKMVSGDIIVIERDAPAWMRPTP